MMSNSVPQAVNGRLGDPSNASAELKWGHPSRFHDLDPEFQWKYGRRHHRYLPDKVPWPLAYESDYLHTEELETAWNEWLGHKMTWFNFKDNPPSRLLDIGCGSGAWALHAANEWPDCEVVGFDLVHIQPHVKYLSATPNVSWVHGNFLSNRLPFDEDSFDFVHVTFIEKGVPESKWGPLFEEITRVLRPGGAIEFITDDILFPKLPSWFTKALYTPTPTTGGTDHDELEEYHHGHALLESLFYSVYERRFINTKPTASVASYFTSYFASPLISATRTIPMPPFRLPPRRIQEPFANQSLSQLSPTYRRESSNSAPSLTPLNSIADDTDTLDGSAISSTDRSSVSDTLLEADHVSSKTKDDVWTRKFEGFPSYPLSASLIQLARVEAGSTSRLGQNDAVSVSDEIYITPDILALHLWRSLQNVLACREAMWEELEDRLVGRSDELIGLGWKPYSGDRLDENEKRCNRAQFDELFEYYTRDMNIRLAWGNYLDETGWSWPSENSHTRAEHYQRDRLYTAFEEAQKQGLLAAPEEPCRVFRAMHGFKGNIEVAHQ